MAKVGSIYYMNEFGTNGNFRVYKSLLAKTTFRKVGKGGFTTSKRDFKVDNLDSGSSRRLKDDGSVLVATNYNKSLFKRLGRFYPIY